MVVYLFFVVKVPIGGGHCINISPGAAPGTLLGATQSPGSFANTSLTTFRIMGTLGFLFLATRMDCSQQRVINTPLY